MLVLGCPPPPCTKHAHNKAIRCSVDQLGEVSLFPSYSNYEASRLEFSKKPEHCPGIAMADSENDSTVYTTHARKWCMQITCQAVAIIEGLKPH